jgi:hypothetical protein
MDALIQIIEKHEGSQTLLASHLKALRPEKKITQAYINNWLNRDKRVPDEWIIPLCESVDFDITPHQFNSVIYPHKHDGLPEQLRQVA